MCLRRNFRRRRQLVVAERAAGADVAADAALAWLARGRCATVSGMVAAGHERDGMADGADRVVPAALLRDVVRYFRPLRVVLFGSSGRGEAGTDSDLDLAVILPDDAPAALLHWRAVNEARRGHDLAVDIVPYRLSAFTTAAQHVGTLPWIIATEGRVIWAKAGTSPF